MIKEDITCLSCLIIGIIIFVCGILFKDFMGQVVGAVVIMEFSIILVVFSEVVNKDLNALIQKNKLKDGLK